MTFNFKQFSISQDKCAMKVGTDGVLLGAWAPADHQPQSVLDIGTGSGLIALMLAQRTNATQIDALEIDGDAYEQAVQNFESSPWDDMLFCFHAGLDELIDDPEDEYDLIVSNPPFYAEDYQSGDAKRDTARFQDSLPFELLIEAADLLLSQRGIFAIIIPYKEEQRFVSLAHSAELYPSKITHVRGAPESPLKRSLIAFSRQNSVPMMDELTIEISRHVYTPEYTALTRDFYLKL